jgi:paraquat-inducible protein B
MITKHDLDYVGYNDIDEYFEQICQHIEANEHSIAREMQAKLSKGQLLAFEQFLDEAYYYELNDNL